MNIQLRLSHSRLFALVMLCFLFPEANLFAQDQSVKNERLNLPGDNFNLAAMLDIFRKSPTLESFEAALNADTSKINNLDLNNDGKVDYIKVFDRPDGSVHTIILQSDLGPNDAQDIAVIFVEKKGKDITIQVVGDEELYGPDYIVEPAANKPQTGTPNPAYQGQQTTVTNNYYYNTEYNDYYDRPGYCETPSSWIIIGFMYGPAYSPWVSPWYWGYYPGWWNPWSPWYWDAYYVHWYYNYPWNGWWYWRTPHHHFRTWYGPYRTNRRTSNTVIRNRTSGVYDRSYQNPRPEVRPTRKPTFPPHTIDIDRNPAVIKPKSGEELQPVRKEPEIKRDVNAPDKRQEKQPVKQTEPVKEKKQRRSWFFRSNNEQPRDERQPEIKPTTVPKERPSPAKRETTPTQPDRQKAPVKPR